MPVSNFEPYLVNAINSFFQGSSIQGLAYRNRQSAFRDQFVDILVDSPIKQYYLAIEAKSIKQFDKNGREIKILYFSERFTINKKGEHQVTRVNEFCEKCGRSGFLAVRIQRGKGGRPSEVHFMPWADVMQRYNDGVLGISLEAIRRYPKFAKSKGVYNFDSVVQVIG